MSVARRISDEVGHRGIVARLGGDEFGILLPQTGSGDAAQVAVSLLSALEQPFQIGELELEITGSIGVAVAQGADDEGGLLLQRADVAMYSAKESHSGWELYSSERDHYSPRRLTLAGELRKAIDTGELEVHYQPKSELATGRVCGVEALVRWRHPRYGIIGPDHFIPVAESAGLIRPLTSFVLISAVENQRELRALGYDLEVAVNLSVRSVLDVNLPNQIAQILSDHGVPPQSLTLEITEGSVMADPTRTIGILGRLAQLGVSISVDDFGTGYSSLSYLKRLPANEVKIDRTFVAGMLANDSDRAIVRSTVDLARNLGLRAVAEGVEDEATWDALCDLGCDYAQGYYVSPPLPVTELRAWLLTRHPAADPMV
jgi:diguanylate cyclase